MKLFGNVAAGTDSIGTVAAKVDLAATNTVLNREYPLIEDGADNGKPRGSLVFDLTVYARIKGEDKPTLQLMNLQLPLARIA